MADLTINTIQPNNLIKRPSGEVLSPIASSDFKEVGKQEVTQEIEQKRAKLTDLKSQQGNGQIEIAELETTELDTVMSNLNVQLQQLQNYLKFERDESSDKMVIFIKDSETDEILRQIPTEEFLAISKNISQYLETYQQSSANSTPPVGMITNETV